MLIFFFIFPKNWNICERTLSGVYVYKMSCIYLEKWPSFGVLKVEKAIFHVVSFDCCVLSILKIYLIWAVQEPFYSHCSSSWGKLTQNHVSRRPNTKFSVWPFLDLVTLNDLVFFKYAHGKLRMILRSVPDTIHVVVLTYFYSIRL